MAGVAVLTFLYQCSFLLQSMVQLGFDFLSPESLGKAVKMAEEIRCLPNDHEAKLQVLEVRERKFSLEAFSASFIIIIIIVTMLLLPEMLRCYLFLDLILGCVFGEVSGYSLIFYAGGENITLRCKFSH